MTSLWRLCSFLLFFNLFFNLLPLLVLPLTFRIRSHIDRCAFPISIRIAIRRSRGVIYLFGLSFVHRFAHALVFCARTKKKRSHKSKMGVCLKDLHFIHWISAMSLSVLTIRVHVPPPPLPFVFLLCVFPSASVHSTPHTHSHSILFAVNFTSALTVFVSILFRVQTSCDRKKNDWSKSFACEQWSSIHLALYSNNDQKEVSNTQLLDELMWLLWPPFSAYLFHIIYGPIRFIVIMSKYLNLHWVDRSSS